MCLGIPGKIVSISDYDNQLGVVDFDGVTREVNLSCIATDKEGLDNSVSSWVLVHVGFAMSAIDEDEAKATLEVLEQLGELQEELAAMHESAA